MMSSIKIIDDDGVLVVGSPSALLRRYTTKDFDYSFPNELLEAQSQGALCAWHAGWGGEHEIEVTIGIRQPSAKPARHVLLVEDDRRVIVMPYSNFTMGSAHGKGSYDLIDGLATIIEVAELGWYEVQLEPRRQHAGRGPSLAHRLDYWPNGHQVSAPTEVPKLEW